MKKSIITGIIIGAAAALLASCGDKEGSEVIVPQQNQQEKAAAMQAARAKLQEKGHEFTEAGVLALLQGDCEAEVLDLYLQAGVPASPQILFDIIRRISTEPGEERQAELVKSVAVLIKNGVNVNAADATGTTALHLAAASWSPEVVKQLLAAGANPQATDKRGATPQVYAFGAEIRELLGMEKIETNLQTPAPMPEVPQEATTTEGGLPALPAEEPAIPSVGDPTAPAVPTAEETLQP